VAEMQVEFSFYGQLSECSATSSQ